MIKICFATTIYNTFNTFFKPFCEHLFKLGGYEIHLISDGSDTRVKNLPDYIVFHPVKMKRGMDFSFDRIVRRIYKVFREQKFDIVYYATPNAAFYSAVAAKRAKIACRVYCQWGLRYLTMKGISKFVFKYFEKLTCKYSAEIRPISHKNMAFAIKEGLFTQKKAAVAGEGGTIGIDLAEYPLKNKYIYSKFIRDKFYITTEIVFGYVGRITTDKGCNELFTAFKNLKIQRKKLLILGSFELDKGMDKHLLEEMKNDPHVIFAGYVEKSEIPKYYAAMDIYLHPTYREGFGRVLKEAGAMGLPIITTDIMGASEVMQNNRSCLLIPPQNAVKLEEAMLFLAENQEIRTNLGIEARKRVEEVYERKIMLEKQYALLEDICKKYNLGVKND